jgi:hypothetical protein
MKYCMTLLQCGLVAGMLAAPTLSAAPLGTAFIYQGRLDQGGQPATGAFLMRFSLWDAFPLGNQLEIAPTNTVPVTKGLFNVSLPFSPTHFLGEDRWLQVEVYSNNFLVPTLLSPRIRLAPSPHSIYALTAGSAASVAANGVTGLSIQNATITAAKIASGQVVKTLNGLHDAVTLTAGSGLSLTPSGNGLTLAATGVGSSPWALNDTNISYSAGRVGIGTNVPSGALHVASGGVAVTGANSPYTGAGKGLFLEKLTGGGGLFGGALFAFDYDAGQPLPLLLNSPGGNVGIGTINPQTRLHVNGSILSGQGNILSGNLAAIGGGVNNAADGAAAFVGGGEGNRAFGDTSVVAGGFGCSAEDDAFVGGGRGNYAQGSLSAIPGGIQNLAHGAASFAAGSSAEALHDGSFVWADQQFYATPPFNYKEFQSTAANQFNIRASGGVRLNTDTSMYFGNQTRQMLNLWGTTFGIGVQSADLYFRTGPNSAFAWHQGGSHVDGQHNPGTGGSTLMTLDNNFLTVRGGGNEQGYIGGDGFGGEVHVGSLNPAITRVALYNIPANDYMHLDMKSCTIYGGADLAEPFPMEKRIDKGSVVVIDEEHPGRLKLSTRAYDTQVAGIVSGANGINPGIALKQEGVLDQGQNVALSGRVYVKADASHGAIKPGDLLTTSDLPGHAMKVSDHTKSQGAILGKAMSALKEGTGLVLVLVTLQ